MAITWVKDTTNYEGGIELGGKQPATIEYSVLSDTATETLANVLTASAGGVTIPAYGSLLVGTSSFCQKKRAKKNTDQPKLWHVTCEFDSLTGNKRDPAEDQKAPDQRRKKWTAHFTPLEWAFFSDLDGVSFTDTAGTPFDPPPRIPLYVDEWTVQFYSSTCNRTTDRGYMNFTNTDTWNGCAPNTALIADISTEEVFEFNAYWFSRTIRFLINPRYNVSQYGKDKNGAAVNVVGGWNPLLVLNAGARELKDKPGGGKQAVPIERNGLVDGRPHPLDKNGVAIYPAVGGGYGTDLVWLKFRTVGTCAFIGLNLTPPWST